MSLSRADASTLEQWWRACLEHPGGLPDGVEPVQTRLIRSVGRGQLDDLGPVFVKVMGFPRRRDRIRYIHRALPGPHEARLLDVARRAGLRCPETVQARGQRRFGVPVLSFLVTRALDALPSAPAAGAMARTAAGLAAAGIFHPDLHPSNFLALPGGETAVLDLQSARLRRPGLSPALRLAMAAKLLAETPEAVQEVQDAALIVPSAVPEAARCAAQIRARGRLQRVRRCMQESTEFSVRRRWNGTEFRRRTCPADGARVEGGRELVRFWLGDRALEVLDGTPPVLGALFRKSWWLPPRHCVYLRNPSRDTVLPRVALLEGFERFQALVAPGFQEATGESPRKRTSRS